MPYWAELWPSGLALARALPPRLDGLRVVELGCGLGVPSLTAAARGADVTALDWARDAIALLDRNAARNHVELFGVAADWRAFTGSFDLVLGADLLYERRNVQALVSCCLRSPRTCCSASRGGRMPASSSSLPRPTGRSRSFPSACTGSRDRLEQIRKLDRVGEERRVPCVELERLDAESLARHPGLPVGPDRAVAEGHDRRAEPGR